MRLTIVIPALNEEDAIGSTIERCLRAKETIIANSPVDDVEVVVVNDGSTDRTGEIAAGYHDIRLISFEKNRGYGAAIKRGFEVGTGDLVAFLDGDGTCDPAFFATLCSALIEENASVAIGSRMGPDSRMPPVRRLGNRIYALILAGLSNRVVTDTASGMRVIRRDALKLLYPLPDGLHFTPAMSARVLMDDRLTIIERPMSYEERIGESKLHVVSDGVRFLRTILEMTLMWRPTKVFFSTAALSLAVMVLLAIHPIETWLRLGWLEEDMIYRLLFCSFLGTMSIALLAAGVLSDSLHRLLDDEARPRTFLATILDRAFTYRGLGITSLAAVPVLAWLVGPGIWSRLTAGYVALHWSRIVLAGLIAFGLGQMVITVLIANVLRFHTDRKSRAEGARAAEHVGAATSSLNIPIPPPCPAPAVDTTVP
ncbi:MAG: glycosyltransferase family 2 protein [Planctomycetota bacterium]|jgi:glycosyltransferase involved in cell wall biosynthesis